MNWAIQAIQEPMTPERREEIRAVLYDEGADPTNWDTEDQTIAHLLADNDRLLKVVEAQEAWILEHSDEDCSGSAPCCFCTELQAARKAVGLNA